MTAHRFETHAMTRSGTARVTVAGELDRDSAPRLMEAVAACLEERPKHLCLDLTGLRFCDCSGFNALLHARMSVLLAGAGFAVEGIGPQPARLLDLIGAADVLNGKGNGAVTVPDAVPARRG